MGVFEKMTEFLIKKQWVVFLLSLLLGFFGFRLVPNDFIDSLPFTFRDVNVAICYAIICIAIYLALSLILYLIKKVNAAWKKRRSIIAKNGRIEAQNAEAIKKIKACVDSWSDFEYSVVMYLLENENKTPYIQRGYRMSTSILDDPKMFNKSTCNGANKQSQGFVIVGQSMQYLLTEEAYEDLNYILHTEGSISNFPRTKVDLQQ